MPGAEYGEAKCWPDKYYRSLAAMRVSSGYRIWILGSEKDSASGRTISEAYE